MLFHYSILHLLKSTLAIIQAEIYQLSLVVPAIFCPEIWCSPMKIWLSVIWLFNLSERDRSICHVDPWQHWLLHITNLPFRDKKMQRNSQEEKNYLKQFCVSFQSELTIFTDSERQVGWGKVNSKWIWYPRLRSILLTPETLNWIRRKAIME